MRYGAFIRGINISGKNRIAMAQLRQHCEDIGFTDVKTIQNSGNVVFKYQGADEAQLSGMLCRLLESKFSITTGVAVIELEKLSKMVDGAPDWWGTDDTALYDELILPVAPATIEVFLERIGLPADGYERVCTYPDHVFWTFDKSHHTKTNWWAKTAQKGIGELITIRTAGTIRRVLSIGARI